MPDSTEAKSLTPRQARWVQEFLFDQNGTQAAIRAGYSPSCAANVAWLFRRDRKFAHVKAALDQALDNEAQANRALRAFLRQELCAIAGSRLPRMIDGDGVDLAKDLEDHDQAAIAQVSLSHFQDKGRTLKLRPWNKLQAINLLLKHFALPARSQGADDISRAIGEVEDQFEKFDQVLDDLAAATAEDE